MYYYFIPGDSGAFVNLQATHDKILGFVGNLIYFCTGVVRGETDAILVNIMQKFLLGLGWPRGLAKQHFVVHDSERPI